MFIIGFLFEIIYICNLITSMHMKYSEIHRPQEDYTVPSVRIIDLKSDQSFLASNLEPIDGGDDPEIDW